MTFAMSNPSFNNRAAWLPTKQAYPFVIDSAPVPELKESEVLIRNHAIAFNPADSIIQKLGWVWDSYPLILGCDVSGEIAAVGSEVKGFKVGDRVIASIEAGGFQEYCVADTALVAKIPDKISFVDGSVLPSGVTTAAVSLFHPEGLKLDFPRLEPKDNGKIVVVWGGSAVVGSCGIQMIRAAGYAVATTAGAHNAQFCKDLGASYVLDHSSEDVEQDIITTLRGQDKVFAGVFTAIINTDTTKKCISIADQLGQDSASRIVATVMPPTMPYTEETNGIKIGYCAFCAEILPRSKLRDVLGYQMSPNEVGPKIWGEWITPALDKGLLRCKPDADVVGQGLESIQKAVDRMGEGVSAKKLVVAIP